MRFLFFIVFCSFVLAVPEGSADSVPYAFETVAGGESGEDWETLVAPEFNDWRQAGSWVQSFSAKEANGSECTAANDINDACPEGSLMSVSAETLSELPLLSGSSDAWSGLYPRDGDHVIRLYADGRNNPDNGIGGGPISGRYAYRAELYDNRALDCDDCPSTPPYAVGDERYYTMSFWAPSVVWDATRPWSVIINQWKGGGPPNFALRLSQAGDYRLIFAPPNEADVGYQLIAAAKPDAWNDLKYYIKYSRGSDGHITIWLNGEEIYDYSGRTLADGSDNDTGYFKFGMYTEIHDERTILFDAVRVSNSLYGETLEAWASDQNDLPIVSIASPQSASQVELGQPIQLSASAEDPSGKSLRSQGGITSVNFTANGASVGSVTSAPFDLSWTPTVEAVYRVVATAVDTDGNTAQSDPIEVIVGNRPPEVTLHSHSDFDNLPLAQVATISVTAEDADGAIQEVEFYVDGDLIKADTASPYSADWTPSQKGEYVLTARALDNEGRIGFASATVTAGATIETESFVSTKDDGIVSNDPDNSSHGSLIEVRSTENISAGLFGFDIAAVPAESQIRDAALRLGFYQKYEKGTPGVEVGVYSATGEWEEGVVSWNTRPSKTSQLLDQVNVSLVGDADGIPYQWDVYESVRDLHQADQDALTFWVEVMQANGASVRAHSRTDSRAEKQPTLALTISDVAITRQGEDATAPSQPSALSYSEGADTGQVTLQWQASTDEVGVADYLIYQNDSFIGESHVTSFAVGGLNLAIDNRFHVIARDPAGNKSTASQPLTLVSSTDTDGDGYVDSQDAFPNDPNEWVDTDGDGTGDNADTDDDGDNIEDEIDNCPLIANEDQADVDGDGQGNACNTDDDGDNVLDDADNCPLVANADQLDTDSDGTGNACDPDDDGDGDLDGVDNCPLIANADQLDTDSDGSGNACDTDDDNDTVLDEADNCPLVSNASQLNNDNDGEGDACDSDDDNDSVPDDSDLFPFDNSEWADSDSDGLGDNADLCDNTPTSETDSIDQYGCGPSDDPNVFEIVIGGEQGQPWEAYAHVVDDASQNGYLVQSFSQGTSSSVNCGDYCQERDIHSVIAVTPDELAADYTSDSNWSDLYARDGDHVIRFYADGRNNSDDGVGGGPSHGRYSKRTELSDNRTDGSFTNGDERYYSLSFWAPSEIWDTATQYSTVISQWKQFGGGNPNFEVRLNSTGNYELTFRSVEHNISETTIGVAKPDQWNDVKYYVKHSESADGVLKIWLDGELVYTYEGQTLYKANEDGYIKFGMYTEFRDQRVLLFDGIRISDSLFGQSLDAWATDQQHLPSIELDSPADGPQFALGAPIGLIAVASDPAGKKLDTPGSISAVTFFANGEQIQNLTEAPYQYLWTPVIEGEYEVTARVTDADGNQSTSSTATVFAGNRPPAVDLTSHTDFDNVPLGVATTLEATASDPDGTVESVSFFADGVLIAVDTTAPYAVSWTPSEKREYLVTARALDGEDGVGADGAAVSAGSIVTSVALIATDDAAIKSNNPDQVNNYSKVEILKRDYTIAGLFGFDLSSISGQQTLSADLELAAHELGGPMTLSVFGAEGDWSESSVTWNTAPTKSQTALDSLDISSLGTYSFDVQAYLRSALAQGADTVTFWLEDTSRSEKTLEIHSHTSTPAPQLSLSVTDVPITQSGGDTQPPTAPTNLVVDDALGLSWSAASDNVGIVDYVVFVNGAVNQVVSTSSATLSDLDSAIDNVVTVTARDPAGNSSPLSASLTIAATVIDSDGDGVDDSVDECPNTPQGEAVDATGCASFEVDTDGDGVPDVSDAFPNDPGEWIDTDGDGTGNNADSDDDNDDTPDNADAFPLDAAEWLDSDTDGIGNNADLDDDNDGLTDVQEGELGTDPLSRDTDGDGWSDKEEVEEGTDPLAASSQPEIQSGLPVWLLYMATQ